MVPPPPQAHDAPPWDVRCPDRDQLRAGVKHLYPVCAGLHLNTQRTHVLEFGQFRLAAVSLAQSAAPITVSQRLLSERLRDQFGTIRLRIRARVKSFLPQGMEK